MIANNKSVTKNRNDGTRHVIGQKDNVMDHSHLKPELVQGHDWVNSTQYYQIKKLNNINHNGNLDGISNWCLEVDRWLFGALEVNIRLAEFTILQATIWKPFYSL